MIRRVIKINEAVCNGCGLCAEACHEDAIAIVDGKAKLIRDDYCDGLGDCLPACPVEAITFEEREAMPYDDEAVQKHLARQKANSFVALEADGSGFSCPGSHAHAITHHSDSAEVQSQADDREPVTNELSQWPVQIKLVPVQAPYFEGAKLLVSADCTAFARGDFHQRFIRGHITLIGCPKLDMADYSEKLTEIISRNNIKSVTVVRMEVPCCGGIENAVKTALMSSGKFIPWQVVTLSINGEILE